MIVESRNHVTAVVFPILRCATCRGPRPILVAHGVWECQSCHTIRRGDLLPLTGGAR